MIEKIKHKKILYALIIRNYRKKKGISFFTEKKSFQQIGYMKHDKNHMIVPHLHRFRNSKINRTSETLIILKGILRVDFYDTRKRYLFSKKLNKGDIIMLPQGGHGFKTISSVEMVEVKQGPYIKIKDKKRFKNIDEKKIKFK